MASVLDSSEVWQYSVWHAAGGIVMYELIHLDSRVRYTAESDAAHWFEWLPRAVEGSEEVEYPNSTAEYDPEHPISDLLYECVARIWQEIRDGRIVAPGWGRRRRGSRLLRREVTT
jgi:hypothetical protein